MVLKSGAHLSRYEIQSPVGSGGMGEVYRARDPRLGREVAIKVLPAAFAADTERVTRFEQEAHAAAALNHPNILAVHDIGQHDGSPYIVSELLDGETLRERLNGGALPGRKAVEYAVQIAHGLAAAHDKGITHRDLKPENVFVTSDGRVKILDFGLAKLTQAESPLVGVSELPTTPPNTLPGVVLGTIGYMAPEQVRGLATDHRSDIFAFGAILYEMLSGHRAFRGDTTADTLSAILTKDPPDLEVAEGHISSGLVHVVNRCLEKNPAARFQSTSDLAFALEALSLRSESSPVVTPAALATRRRARFAWPAATAVLLGTIAVLAWMVATRSVPGPSYAIRFQVPPPTDAAFTPTEAVGAPHIAISLDGQRLAFVAPVGSGRPSLWVRGIDSLDAIMLASTEDASFPFWSPDGSQIGFFAQGKLKKVLATGGSVQTLADAPQGRGGSWARSGIILFAPNINDPLRRVSSAGGVAMPVTALDSTRQETSHRWPQFLADGRRFLFFVRSGNQTYTGVYLGSLESSERTLLLRTNAGAVYTPPGYMLALRDESLMAHRVDLDARTLVGEPIPIVERLGHSPDFNYAAFSSSETGVLVYGASTIAPRTALTWVDRSGRTVGSVTPEGEFSNPSLSPDRSRVAVARLDRQTGKRDIWVFDVAVGTGTRFSFDPSDDAEPLWSPDGRAIAFRSNREGHGNLYRKVSSGTGTEEKLFESATGVFPTDWSKNGQWIAFQTPAANSGWNLGMLDLAKRMMQPFLESPANEMLARFSPDARWIAYVSDERGTREVYVQSFPPSGGKWQVSAQGGTEPMWRGDGRELFFVSPDFELLAAGVRATGDTFEAGTPQALFNLHTPIVTAPFGSTYAVSPDGQRFLVNRVVEGGSSTSITVVLNWQAALGARER